MKKDMLTITQAAERAGVTPHALRCAIQRGTLTAIRYGPFYLVSAVDVDAYRERTGGERGRPKRKAEEEAG